MDRAADLVRLLKEEYGITSIPELTQAIARLGTVDISPFCASIGSAGKEKAS